MSALPSATRLRNSTDDDGQPLVFDLSEPPPALDENGRAGWAQVYGLQLHVTLTQLRRQLAVVDVCTSCGAAPCVNPSFCAASRAVDERRGRRRFPRPSSPPRERPTPQATIEAIMLCVRERGLVALGEPVNAERLGRCDGAAKAEIDKRIAQLIDARVITNG